MVMAAWEGTDSKCTMAHMQGNGNAASPSMDLLGARFVATMISSQGTYLYLIDVVNNSKDAFMFLIMSIQRLRGKGIINADRFSHKFGDYEASIPPQVSACPCSWAFWSAS